MEVSLRQVTKKNYEEVCELDVTNEQEDYVACNMWSIVESKYNDGYETRAIYMKEEPVGFFMWVQESEVKVSIWRFMVDKKHQQKSIGRVSLNLALAEIKEVSGLKEILLCKVLCNLLIVVLTLTPNLSGEYILHIASDSLSSVQHWPYKSF